MGSIYPNKTTNKDKLLSLNFNSKLPNIWQMSETYGIFHYHICTLIILHGYGYEYKQKIWTMENIWNMAYHTYLNGYSQYSHGQMPPTIFTYAWRYQRLGIV